jgi:hypothetical protein
MRHTLYRDGHQQFFDTWEELEDALGDDIYTWEHEGKTYYHASASAAFNQRVSTVWTFTYRQAPIVNARDFASEVRKLVPKWDEIIQDAPKPVNGPKSGPGVKLPIALIFTSATAGK